MALTHALPTNNYGVARLIVATSPSNGTHTTLTSAMADASVGDTIFLRDSVTENVTITPGVNIAAWQGSSANTPSIIGTLTMTGAGTSTISGIRLQTNGASLLAVSGSAASTVNLNNCYLNCTNSTGISFTSSSSVSSIFISNCRGNLGTTGIALFSHSSSGLMLFQDCLISNTGGSSTSSTCSSGILNGILFQINSPITFSGTGAGTFENCIFFTASQNVTSLILGGSDHTIRWSNIFSGSASSINISTGSTVEFCNISSSNTNAITGSGILNLGYNSFSGNSSTINTTTVNPIISRYGVDRSTKQPCFQSYLNATVSNVTGDGTNYTVVFNATAFDQGSNFNTGTGVFTAPYTGRYLLTTNIIPTGLAAGNTISLTLNTNASIYTLGFLTASTIINASNLSIGGSVVADMTVGDTASVKVQISGGTKVVGVLGSATRSTANFSFFSGILLC